MIKKVISGGQVGADQGGIAAAHDLLIPTGGTAPKGFKTKYGNTPELALLGLVESTSDKYPPRTFENVKNSNGTIRLARDFNTAGELCTMKAIKQYKKPFIDIDLTKPLPSTEVVDWIYNYHIKVLNVAGNAGYHKKDSTLIFETVRDYMKKVLAESIRRETLNEN